MSATDYLGGALIFAAVIGAALGGGWLLLRRRYGGLRGSERIVAFGLLTVLGLLAIHLVPAMFGLLGRGSVLVASGLWLAGCTAVPARQSIELPLSTPPDHGERFSWPLAVVALGAIVVFVASFVGDQLVVPPDAIDYTNFHLPSVVAWIQSGTIWQVDGFLPDLTPGNYPNNGDALVLAFVLPWHNDFLAHLAIWPCFALTGFATHALALRAGSTRSSALVAGALASAIPAVAVSAMALTITDSAMYFGFVVGVLFLLRHHASDSTADLVLAGLALGLSFGTKWYAVYAVAIVVVVWAVARLIDRRGWRTVIRQSAAVTGLVALAGGLWLVRNWIVSGNPAFPVKMELFGVTIFDAPADPVRESFGFTVLDYFGDWDVWWKLDGDPALGAVASDGIALQWLHALAAPALLAILGCLLAAGLLITRRRTNGISASPILAGLVSVALIATAYSVTPYSAGGPEGLPLLVGADSRYVVPAILIAMAVAACVASLFRWGSLVFCALGLAAVAHGIYWAATGTAAGLSGTNWAIGIMLVSGVALGWWALEPWWPRIRSNRRRVAILGGLAFAVGVLCLIAGRAVEREFNDARYVGIDPVLDAVAEAGPAKRIGLAGVWTDTEASPVLPSFGPRFSNDVEYIGPVTDEMQRRYESEKEFIAALENGNYELVVAGTGRPDSGPSPELAWLDAAGWTQVATSERLVLYAPPA